ncbi:hypothetical protein MLD38_034493 [Melastoma candidum]|uniref:Uncharacterized protein n=1 Tax=Melastoma candidum TaxID=119954 RepID=A0ACB9MA35_9MYRT|nr:hypothetical protein MLD38_034493 [Melastoma candidum]
MEEFVPMSNENTGSRASSLLYALPVFGLPSGNTTGYGGKGNSCRDHMNGCGDNSNCRVLDSLGIAGAFQLQQAAADEQFSMKRVAQHQAEKFRHPLVRDPPKRQGRRESSSNDIEALKVKIIAHPQYPDLLQAYTDCQKVRTLLPTETFFLSSPNPTTT